MFKLMAVVLAVLCALTVTVDVAEARHLNRFYGGWGGGGWGGYRGGYRGHYHPYKYKGASMMLASVCSFLQPCISLLHAQALHQMLQKTHFFKLRVNISRSTISREHANFTN
jgi:hypothetical protein